MTLRVAFIGLTLLVLSGVAHGQEERWNNFAEDADLRYYLDRQSVLPVADGVYVFWVKSVPKQRGYFQREYGQGKGYYMLSNYELDCASSSYRKRGDIIFDRQRREIAKTLSEGSGAPFEPVPPESVLELAQEELCATGESADLEDESPEEQGVFIDVPVTVLPVRPPRRGPPPSLR